MLNSVFFNRVQSKHNKTRTFYAIKLYFLQEHVVFTHHFGLLERKRKLQYSFAKTTTKVFSFVSSKFIISNLKQVIKKYKINTFYTFELEIKNKINKNL